MGRMGPAKQAAIEMLSMSHLPPSMNGSVFLYVFALTGVMCITVIGICATGWMVKEAFFCRARKNTVLFNFRMMMGLAGFAAFARSIVEVLYLQMYADPKVSEGLQGAITICKRIADGTSILFVAGWFSLLVMIYPYVREALTIHSEHDEQEILGHLEVRDYPSIKRLTRPFFIFIGLLLVAVAFAFSKVHGS